MFRLFQLIVLNLIGVVVFYHALFVKIRTGKSTLRLPPSNRPANLFTDIVLWLSISVWAVFIYVWALNLPGRSFLGPAVAPPFAPLQFVGLGSAALGTALMLLGLFTLGPLFRTSVDYSEGTKLVTRGVFRFCRNPVALGLILNGWGTALMIQSLNTAVLAIVFFAVNRMRVFFEEKRLAEILGEEYKKYCAAVGRFGPKIERRQET
jgi:protein-S-isoprenylcysteine O-methyltransferase Ste14